MAKKRLRNPIKFEHKPGGTFVRERLIEPSQCAKGSYLTITHSNHASTPRGVKIVTCKLLGTGKRGTQSILHTVPRFRLKHGLEWMLLKEKKTKVHTVTADELMKIPAYRSARGFAGAFSGGFGGQDFPSTDALKDWMDESGELQRQRDKIAAHKKAKRVRALQRKAARGSLGVLDTEVAPRDFPNAESVWQFLQSIGPKGYDGMFGGR